MKRNKSTAPLNNIKSVTSRINLRSKIFVFFTERTKKVQLNSSSIKKTIQMCSLCRSSDGIHSNLHSNNRKMLHFYYFLAKPEQIFVIRKIIHIH